MTKIRITVVTVTYGARHSYLERLVDLLATFDDVRIVIVDNGSSAETKAYLNTAKARVKDLSLIHISEPTRPY